MVYELFFFMPVLWCYSVKYPHNKYTNPDVHKKMATDETYYMTMSQAVLYR